MLRTPLRHSSWLSQATGAEVYLKLENLQPTHSYKIRGATNAVLKIVETRGPGTSIVTASAGNHGRAMAHAAAQARIRLTVHAPDTAPRSKLDAIRQLGADLRLCRDYDEAERRAKEQGAGGEDVFVSPYAHPDVIAGAGTIALELLDEQPAMDAMVAPIGGGGLISGIALVASPRVSVCGAEVEASTPFTTGIAAGHLVRIDVGDSLADGLTGNLDPDSPTFEMVRRHVHQIAVVPEDSLSDVIRGVFHHERQIIEGAAAVAVAAVSTGRLDIRGKRVAIIVTGANIDAEKLLEILG